MDIILSCTNTIKITSYRYMMWGTNKSQNFDHEKLEDKHLSIFIKAQPYSYIDYVSKLGACVCNVWGHKLIVQS